MTKIFAMSCNMEPGHTKKQSNIRIRRNYKILKNQVNNVSMKTFIRSLSIEYNFTRMRVFKWRTRPLLFMRQLPLIRDTLLSMFTTKSKIKKRISTA